MIKKLRLTRVYRSTKDKEGNELKTKLGKPYERVSIKTEEYGDKWLSGFGNEQNKEWKEGDEVTLEVKEVGQYLNFSPVKMESRLMDMFQDLNKRVKNLEDKLLTSDNTKVPDFNETEETTGTEDELEY